MEFLENLIFSMDTRVFLRGQQKERNRCHFRNNFRKVDVAYRRKD